MSSARASRLVAVAAAAILLAACTPEAVVVEPAPTPTPVETVAPSGDGVLRIGTLFPTTGATAFIGAAQVAGVNAAVREINQAGGVLGAPVEVVNRDSGDAGSQTLEASLQALVERGVDVVIGPSSSVLVERALPIAAEAGIPIITPAATYPRLTEIDADGWIFRTIPSYPHQGAVLGAHLPGEGAESVALVTTGDALARTLEAPLQAALAENGGELVGVAHIEEAGGAKAALAEIVEADPDAVVLASPDNGELTRAVILALREAGLAGSKLWLTSQNLADYSQALPAGALDGVRGLLEGFQPDAAFIARLKVEDPGLGDPRYAAEAYEAVVLAALAAVLADDDGGPSIRSQLVAATREGIRCSSFGECLDVLEDEPDIAYEGLVGPLRLDPQGDPALAAYGIYTYGAGNTYSRSGVISG